MTSSALQAMLQAGSLVGAWTLDAARSEVRLKTKSMWGLVPVEGVFHQVTGKGNVSTVGEVTGAVTVAAGSIDTKNSKRDEHLRSADFFDVGRHPNFTVAVDGVQPRNGGVTVTGSLTVRGRTRPMSFDAKVSGADGEVWLDSEVQVKQADFGLTRNQMGMVSANTTIVVHAVFTRG